MIDDTLKDSPDVVEALRRLPKHVAEERQYRISRALYLSMRKEILPKEEWTTYDSVLTIQLCWGSLKQTVIFKTVIKSKTSNENRNRCYS